MTSDKIEDVLGRVSLLEDDEIVAQKQVREDIHTFGGRPEPTEFTEIDEDNLPRKQSATALGDGISSHAQVRKKLNSRQTYSVTAMDWNSGASHLDAWLNQSAIPTAAPAYKEQQGMMENPPAPSNIPTAAQEMEEIKVFRNVHICPVPEPVIDGQHLEFGDELSHAELETQVYYRNIIDRYPKLRLYLALRLARANRDRADRLRRSRFDENASHELQADQGIVSLPPLPLPQSPKPRGLGTLDTKTQRKYECKVCEKRFTRPSSLKTHMCHTTEKRK